VKHESVLASGDGISVSPKRNETTEILWVFLLFLFHETTQLPVGLTLPLSSPPPYLSTLLINERMNEKKNEGNKRKEQANRLAFFIPA
jgi:hypothetical protein